MPTEAPSVLQKEDPSLYPLPLPAGSPGAGLSRCLFVFAPLIHQARERVRRGAHALSESYGHAHFDPSTIDGILATALLPPLQMMMARVLVLEVNVARLEGMLIGDTPEERFESFVIRLREPHGAEGLFAEYPVLVDLIEKRLDGWVAFSLEFLQHLCEDWHSLHKVLLSERPGMLAKMNASAGDTHRNGRSVMVLSFTGGETLVYKPRSMAIDVHFQELLTWLNHNGAQPPFQVMKLINRDTHGWSEFIPSKDCLNQAELARFYERQGSYLAILYALHAADFHYENLIAMGEHPFLIDLEALFHQHLNGPVEDAEQLGAVALRDSVLRVGLLPMRLGFGKDYAGVDVSGLSNPAGQLSPRAVPQLDGMDTDEMRVVRRRAKMQGGRNRPSLNGQEASVLEYVESLITGFRSMYGLLLAHRGNLSMLLGSFAQDQVRFIARPTQAYASILYESFHPDVLRHAEDRRALLERMQEVAREVPSLGRLTKAESTDLLRGDIPLFTARPGSLSLWNSDGEELEQVFDTPAIAAVKRHILQLSEEDLNRQLWVIRASIGTLSQPPSFAPKSKTTLTIAPVLNGTETQPELWLSTACTLGDRLAELAVRKGGAADWIGLAGTDDQHRSFTPLGIDLYEGLPGVLLFLAYLGVVSGDRRHLDLAKAGVKTLLWQIDRYRDWDNIGGFAGWAGVLYSLSHVGTVLGDSTLLEKAAGLLDRISEKISLDHDLDVIGGSAGCALAIQSLHYVLPSARGIEVARACGERLLQTAEQTACGIGWRCLGKSELPLTGFAHGNAGIAYSLLSIAGLTGESRFREAARAAIEYERLHFSPEHGNWPDLRSNKKDGFVTAWCHGAPGIGLSRLLSLPHLDDPLLKVEIDAALSTTLAHGFGGSHTLCHGDLGNAAILTRASEILKEPEWAVHAQNAARCVVESANREGWDCGHALRVESPGLMTGIAGIGLALLRWADPVRVPFVLALDPPRGVK